VFGLTGILIALVVLTIVLAGVFLVRPSITTGATGKILAFIGLCVLPALCIGSGMSIHMQRSQQTSYCISCHSMESHGQSLYVLNTSYIPAQHFQNHFVPADKACYTCHTDYTMYGPLKDKLKGLRYLYMEYVSTPPKVIHLDGTYSNLQCLHCHAGARNFEENLARMPSLASLESGQISCISSGCHDMIHNVSEVDHLKMWTEGAAPAAVTLGSSSPAPAKAKPGIATAASKAPAGSSAGKATAAGGKGIFDSQHCSTCHGASGGGSSGPALTHISNQYPPAKLTAVLKAPTAKMKAAGMVALTLNAVDMKALVSYVTSLGGTSASAATPPAAGSSPAAPANAKAAATTEAPKAASAAAPPAAGSTSPASARAEPAATAAPSKTTTGSAAGAATAAGGKGIFDSQHCGTCHGASGGGGSGPALTHISSQYPPAKLTAVLKAPTAKMKAAGMVALTLNAADMKALVSYVTSLGGTSASAATPPAAGSSPAAPANAKAAATTEAPKAASAAAPPAAGSTSPASARAEPAATAAPSKTTTGSAAGAATAAGGKGIFDSQHCGTCHGASGGGGSGPALTHISSQYPPAKLTAVLKAPTAKMKAAGMVPLTLSAADMKALVSYVTRLSGETGATAQPGQGQYAENKEDLRIHAAAFPSAIKNGYRIFAVKCNECHELDKSLQAGASPTQAVAEVKRMQSMASSHISDKEAKEIVDFLNYNQAHPKP